MLAAAVFAGTSQAGIGDLGGLGGERDERGGLLDGLLGGGSGGGGGSEGGGGNGGGDDSDDDRCTKLLERLGVCHRHVEDPQEDFEAYSGAGERNRKRAKRDEAKHGGHGHHHGRSKKGASSSGEVEGFTTLDRTIVGGDPAGGFQFLELGDGEPRILREDLAEAKPGRANRRVSLLYAAQTTDWQIPDEESPMRVEFLEPAASPPFPPVVSGAWRPQEALTPHAVDQMIRQLNLFTDSSPVAAGDGSRAPMDLALVTGDQADNQHRNETEWVVRLLEGGPLNPNSGIDDFSVCPGGVGPLDPQLADPLLYAGVQDYDDYVVNDQFYDPDQPIGTWGDFPSYPGLMDRAQEPFQTPGLDVPSYVTPGNHDGLAQGNQKSIRPFEDVGTGCIKPLLPLTDLDDADTIFDPANLLALLGSDPNLVMLVPPDPNRQLVDKVQYKQLHDTGAQPDAHGFDFVDPAELAASNGAANYYAWDAKPGLRMISIDTMCEGGVAGDSASGNIDDPQWQWLTGELEQAQDDGKLIVAFGHHPIRSLSCVSPDETPPLCTSNDPHGHDTNPGCDLDPRDSSPVHDGADLSALFLQYPNLIAYVGGHTHENTLSEFDAGDGPGDFWGIESASMTDWPPQSRLIELMDNCDGTLSFFGTIVDSAAPATAPEGALQNDLVQKGLAGGFDLGDLGSIARTLAYNDPQVGFNVGGQGEPEDRNVELLIDDPREEPSEDCSSEPVDDDPRDEGPGDGDGDQAGAGGGSLPFTGLLLGVLLVIGAVLVGNGLIARRLAAWREGRGG